MNKIALFKSFDRFIGRPLAFLMSSPRESFLGQYTSFLFIRPGGIGDAVLLIPAIKAVKLQFPSATIDILAERRNADVFSLSQDIARVFRYEKPRDLLTVLRSRYDVVVDTEQWHRLSAVVARLIRASTSLGFGTNDRGKLFSHPATYSHDDYEVYSFLRLVEPLTGKVAFDPEVPFLAAPEMERGTRKLLQTIEKFVCLFPGGTIQERQWGGERFHALAGAFAEKGYAVVVVGGKGDRRTAEDIVLGLPYGVNLAGKLSLRESAAVITRSSLLVTGDSGIMHLGYALGSKVVALFGPGIEKKWAPRSSRVAVINKHLPCSPCTKFGYTPRCPRNAACMREISVQEVVDRSLELLTR